MAITAEQELYYLKCKHELGRSRFFGTVPNYEAAMLAECLRLEGEDPEYQEKVTTPVINQYRAENPYGYKKGSPNSGGSPGPGPG